MSPTLFQLIASAPRGFSDLLARELESLGAREVRDRSTGVWFTGDLELAYRVCLWSRIANRLFLEIARFEAQTVEAFYAAAKALPWEQHVRANGTIACDFTGRHPAITNTQFGALKLKDAIVDSLRESAGQRPSVNVDRPNVRIHAHSQGTTITVSIDLSGESLHRRGYRGEAGEAPVKENLAAGILIRAGWPALASNGAAFLDPLCGSGTFVIEAAMIAANIAPGAQRDYFGFLGWRGHDSALWERVRNEARTSADKVPSVIQGRDRDPALIRSAQANARRAGVERFVAFEPGELTTAASPQRPYERAEFSAVQANSAAAAGPDTLAADSVAAENSRAAMAGSAAAIADLGSSIPYSDGASGERMSSAAAADTDPSLVSAAPSAVGLLCTNPPYGVRLEDRERAREIHRQLGVVLRERFVGWQAAVLTGAPELGLEFGIRAHRTHTVWNGALECRLLRMNVAPESFREASSVPGAKVRRASNDPALRESAGAKMFANRLGKNLKRLRPWAERNDVTCYRIYDADMPEYSFAIDRYRLADSDATHLYVQEYAAPASIDEESVRRRRGEAISVLPEVTGVPAEHIHLRTRRRVARGDQYQKLDERASFHIVAENGLKFEVNFDDYLDTGLFLDHRITRAKLREAAQGKGFLNLFAYTGSATVYAAAGGARSSLSVDLSRTYLDWAQRNLTLNGLARHEHAFLQADCREWLREVSQGRERFDLIFLDPPTFSNSKRMEGVLDVQRDHNELIDACMHILAPGGLLVFSTNAQRFRLDDALGERYAIQDISAPTLPEDFARNPRIHRTFEVRARDGSQPRPSR
jgi:23S rRNA (guanine2445-N2)-methyltransferase / 23S rRNA (guanine2069-N7)-methyltransferase